MIWTLVLLWIVLAEADRWRCVCCSSIQDLARRRDDDGDGLWETEREFSGWTFASCNRSWSQFRVTVNLRMETLNFRERHEDCLKKLPAKLTGHKTRVLLKDWLCCFLSMGSKLEDWRGNWILQVLKDPNCNVDQSYWYPTQVNHVDNVQDNAELCTVVQHGFMGP